jgi:condensin complex subunit 1
VSPVSYDHEQRSSQLIRVIFERFGVAEQAINTLYLLGEQPDVVCSTIIKNLNERAFGNPDRLSSSPELPESSEDPEAKGDNIQPLAGPSSPRKGAESSTERRHKASSFKIAQLLFVVGHVAIKHIVYLELVEREFKRRKDEAGKGEIALLTS